MEVVEAYCLYPLRVCEVRTFPITAKRLRKRATLQPTPPYPTTKATDSL